jgi:hypothetical protein
MKPLIGFRARLLAIAILAVVSTSATAQRNKPPTAADQALIQANETLLQALRSGDSAQLPTLLAEDLVFTDAAGVARSKSQLLAGISRGYRPQIGTPEAVSAHVDGNVGLLSYQSRGTNAAGDTIVIRTSAVYVLRASRWQLTSQSSTGGETRAVAMGGATAVTIPPPSIVLPARPISTTGRVMTARANGTFEVDAKPLSPYNAAPDAQLGRFSLDKQYYGELEGTGKGEMLTAGNATTGSAGYVAVERVTGTLRGKKGSFSLQHSGTMSNGALSLTITVVPGSGTGELTGITGTLNIIVEGGKHSYVLDYSLPIAN